LHFDVRTAFLSAADRRRGRIRTALTSAQLAKCNCRINGRHESRRIAQVPLTFLAIIQPARRFEEMLRITEGLKRNGLLNEKGLPKSILHLGIMFEMGESYLAGMPLWLQRAIFGPLAALTQDRSRSRCISDAAARRARAELGERHADRIKRCSIYLAVSAWGPGVEPPG